MRPGGLGRFLGSLLLALLVVGGLLAVGLNVYGLFQEEGDEMAFHDVELLSEIERARMAEQLGETPGRRLPKLPPLDQIPAVNLQRNVQGFVQLEVEVDEYGQVMDVRVLGATPAGIYEQQAVEQIRTRKYAPVAAGGEAGRRLEIVEFQVSPELDD